MSQQDLPDRASLEYLRKLAKDHLRELRSREPAAKLSDAQLAIARQYGFPSWRALKAEVERRSAPDVAAFFAACSAGGVAALRELLSNRPALAQARNQYGATGLHLAVASPECVRLLLEHGADPNARELGDNASALHLAAANRQLESVRALLDAGADVHGHGDLHDGDVIGWAVGDGTIPNDEVVKLLLERGARHTIFSAIALNDLITAQNIVEENPEALARRRSRFEEYQTPLHFALAAPTGIKAKPPQYEMAELLIELGADQEAEDGRGRTPLAVAMLSGDSKAMQLLKAAGAREPKIGSASVEQHKETLQKSLLRLVPMLCVDDVSATVAWYQSIGCTLHDYVPKEGPMDWADMSFGPLEFMVQSRVGRPTSQIALWFYMKSVDELYEILKNRQMQAARATLAGGKAEPAVEFQEDLYEPFYGGRQFSVADNNGFEIVFMAEK